MINFLSVRDQFLWLVLSYLVLPDNVSAGNTVSCVRVLRICSIILFSFITNVPLQLYNAKTSWLIIKDY